MKVLSTIGWEDYELLDTGNGARLERFGRYRLVRPDPQIIWKPRLTLDVWSKVDAVFHAETKQWEKKSMMPDSWQMRYHDIVFTAKLSPFKHTGVFPEQVLQWEWLAGVLEAARATKKSLKVLNLFGYTGIASLIAARAGAEVTHVDASRPTIGWARENQALSGLNDKPIRWILDDAVKFVQREAKRGVQYDGILMDPPIYGHGPGGEVWNFNDSFPQLLALCRSVLTQKPLFVLVNAYAISSSALMLENVLMDYFSDNNATLEAGELALQEKSAKRLLSTGIFARWSSNK
jgi:23S rRNA (cytosine1962-C5)-methyltransferase